MGGNDESGNDVILEKINNVQGDVSEIKQDVKNLSNNYRAFERESIRERANLVGKVNAAQTYAEENRRRIVDIEKKMTEIQNALQPLIATNKLLAFIGGALGISIIALIWALITGQAILAFP